MQVPKISTQTPAITPLTPEQEIISKVEPKSEVLFEAQTLFPFDLFPACVTVTPTSVTVINKYFFGQERIQTIAIKDIFTIEVQTAFFFARVLFWYRQMNNMFVGVDYLSKANGLQLQKIVQGLIIAQNENIDPSLLTPRQTIEQVQKLVHVQGV
ncbi:MAG TPA: hypothetical protein VD999_04040 [Vitreimonas sp.]|nr:hypothetical protein [Vitreimonas sp.]